MTEQAGTTGPAASRPPDTSVAAADVATPDPTVAGAVASGPAVVDVAAKGAGDGPARPYATVVIVNWNGAHLLPACLDGIAKQETGFAFQTWVVDNASADGSRELLAERYPWVRVVASDRNLGFAGGNNLALRQVTTPYAVLVNNDAVPEPTWLAALLAPFAEPGGRHLGATTGKVVFLPRFLRIRLHTPTFIPGPHDSRELGIRVSSVTVDGREALREVLWEKLTYGAEGPPKSPYFWTRGEGELCVPIPDGGPVTLGFTWAAESRKQVTLSWDGPTSTGTGGGRAELAVGPESTTVTVTVGGEAPRVDVINNVGGIVLVDGYGADRGYQQVDTGQFDQPEDVFTACGNGMAIRASLGHELGWFDDAFFLYYEDTDLSWRIRARGQAIRYVPGAVLRHIHSASSVEWSPLFVFHTDRNRLLMLTKDATALVALSAVVRYPVTTASIAVRTLRQAWQARSRPAVRPTLLRLRVIASYLRLLPGMLRARREIGATATERRASLQSWLVGR
ncbi:glycosyltransferase family 2 protein [Frankia sp. AgKG'84/4]|uniref:glycosyltransferase family 2 protein n=1 Tax=Frankia sp. AgKG'84/4 TaxID=573490 RepID=UPI00200BD79B|nr:glycosyltransferase family 2 protein [Frankia sp. AgKG'84/4]MCL9794381.1 glycosyltransferase family 2 protein [Frankia sp. AgKG'84/4]